MSIKLDVNNYMITEMVSVTSFELSQMFGGETNKIHSMLSHLQKTGFVKKNGYKKVKGKKDATLWIHTGRKSKPSSHPKLNKTQQVLDFILSGHFIYTRTDIAKFLNVSHNVIYWSTEKLLRKESIKLSKARSDETGNIVDIIYTGFLPFESYTGAGYTDIEASRVAR